jgi:hypothetical protein
MEPSAPVQSILFQLGSDHVKRVTFAISVLAFGLASSVASAQQKQHVSFASPAANTTYPQQHAIDVGDIPGHQVRVYEIHRTFPTNPPVINGLKLTEQWVRGYSDFIDLSGPSVVYATYVFENGDKMFSRSTLEAQSKGDGKLTTAVAGVITGGTGKFLGIQGTTRSTNSAEPKAGINENQTDMDYWIGN